MDALSAPLVYEERVLADPVLPTISYPGSPNQIQLTWPASLNPSHKVFLFESDSSEAPVTLAPEDTIITVDPSKTYDLVCFEHFTTPYEVSGDVAALEIVYSP